MKVTCAKCGKTTWISASRLMLSPLGGMPRRETDEVKYRYYCVKCQRELRRWLGEVDKKLQSLYLIDASPDKRAEVLYYKGGRNAG